MPSMVISKFYYLTIFSEAYLLLFSLGTKKKPHQTQKPELEVFLLAHAVSQSFKKGSGLEGTVTCFQHFL